MSYLENGYPFIHGDNTAGWVEFNVNGHLTPGIRGLFEGLWFIVGMLFSEAFRRNLPCAFYIRYSGIAGRYKTGFRI